MLIFYSYVSSVSFPEGFVKKSGDSVGIYRDL